jgi:hypothetical protein
VLAERSICTNSIGLCRVFNDNLVVYPTERIQQYRFVRGENSQINTYAYETAQCTGCGRHIWNILLAMSRAIGDDVSERGISIQMTRTVCSSYSADIVDTGGKRVVCPACELRAVPELRGGQSVVEQEAYWGNELRYPDDTREPDATGKGRYRTVSSWMHTSLCSRSLGCRTDTRSRRHDQGKKNPACRSRTKNPWHRISRCVAWGPSPIASRCPAHHAMQPQE